MSETYYRPTHVRIRLESRNTQTQERATATESSTVTVKNSVPTAIVTDQAMTAVSGGHDDGDLEYFYDTDADADNGTYKAIVTTINGDNNRDTTTVFTFEVDDP